MKPKSYVCGFLKRANQTDTLETNIDINDCFVTSVRNADEGFGSKTFRKLIDLTRK